MKTINTLAIAAFTLTLVAYFSTLGTPAESGGDRNVDLPPPKPRSARLPAEAKPEPPPALAAKPGPNPVLEALRSNDSCGVNAAKSDNYTLTGNDALALLETIDPGPEVTEILAADGPLLGTRVKKSKFPGVNLLWALRLAGIYDRAPGGPMEDLATAHAMLEALEKSEPGNAAYPYFRLAVEGKQRLPAATRRKTAEAIAGASFFDSHLDDANAEILRGRTRSPAHLILYRMVQHRLELRPHLHATLAQLTSEELHVPPADRRSIGRLLMSRAERADGDLFSGEYNPEEYGVGQALAQDTAAPDVYELSERRRAERGLPAPEAAPGIVKSTPGGTECDSRELEEFFYANRGRIIY